MAFIIYRTGADPRHLDPTLDPNDRPPGTTIWGDPRQLNYGANNIGRYTTISSYLSQWAQSSPADGPDNLARARGPVLLIEHTADASVVPVMNQLWADAAGARLARHVLKGGTHYLAGQPQLVAESVAVIAAWAGRLQRGA